MALDKVIQAILEDGRKEAALVVEEGMREKERLLSEARLEAEKLVQERREEAKSCAERHSTRELAKADIEANRIGLKAQKEVIDSVYALALKKLSERSFAETILRLKSTELKGSWVYCNEMDKAALVKALPSYDAKFGGTINCAGGLIVESGDRKVMTDCRLESILKDVWEDSVTEIVSILRGGG